MLLPSAGLNNTISSSCRSWNQNNNERDKDTRKLDELSWIWSLRDGLSYAFFNDYIIGFIGVEILV